MVSTRLKAAQESLKYWEEQAWIHALGDDFYYQSEQKKIDDANIAHWKEVVKELENDEN